MMSSLLPESCRTLLRAGFPVAAILLLAGCQKGAAPPPAPKPPVEVKFVHPVQAPVTPYEEFGGRALSPETVELRSRVSGYLTSVNFKDGQDVKKGDVLFEIEPRTYQAAFDQAKGNLLQLESRLKRLDADLARAEGLLKKGAISKEEYEKTLGDRGEATGLLAANRAVVARTKLDLEYTNVTAPISGRVSRYLVTVGNLVQGGDQAGGGTLLTTIVSVDPMYVYFDVDEHTALRVRQLIREGKSDSPREGKFPVFLGLANETGFPHQGTVNFVDNQVSPRTGTIRLRGVFPNKDQLLLPGFFARVRSPVGRPHKALLVNERALDTDQGQKLLYVVNEKNEVVPRPVKLGVLQDGLREITDGILPTARVIVTGLQQIRPGMIVDPTLVEMPVSPAVATATKSEKPPTP